MSRTDLQLGSEFLARHVGERQRSTKARLAIPVWSAHSQATTQYGYIPDANIVFQRGMCQAPRESGVSTFGERLLAARLEAGARTSPPQQVTQLAIAVRCGVEQPTVSKWEGDSLEAPLSAVQTMASYLGVTGGWLGFGEMPRYPGEWDLIARAIPGIAQQRGGVSAVVAAEADEQDVARQNQQGAVGAGPVDQATAQDTPRPRASSKAKKPRRET